MERLPPFLAVCDVGVSTWLRLISSWLGLRYHGALMIMNMIHGGAPGTTMAQDYNCTNNAR